MKFAGSIFFIALFSFFLQVFLPWWSLVLAAAIVGFFLSSNGIKIFFAGFLGCAIVWWIYALIIDFRNDSLLSGKIAELFYVKSSIILILVCGLIAGIAGGFASLTGWSFKKIVAK